MAVWTGCGSPTRGTGLILAIKSQGSIPIRLDLINIVPSCSMLMLESRKDSQKTTEPSCWPARRGSGMSRTVMERSCNGGTRDENANLVGLKSRDYAPPLLIHRLDVKFTDVSVRLGRESRVRKGWKRT